MPDVIRELTFAEHVRMRPGMYVGGLNDRGLRQAILAMITDVVDSGNAIKNVMLEIQNDRQIRLKLDGELVGFKTEWCVATTTDRGPTLIGSKCLFSLMVASSLCDRLTVEWVHACRKVSQSFSRGVETTVAKSEPSDEDPGLMFVLQLDSQLFPNMAEIGFLPLSGRFQEMAIFHPRVHFRLIDLRDSISRDYWYRKGLLSYLEEIEFNRFTHVLDDYGKHGRQRLYNLSIAAGDDASEAVIYEPLEGSCPRQVHTFANGLRTMGHGTHLLGLERGFSDVLKCVDPQGWKFRTQGGGDVLAETTVLLSVKLKELEYFSSTKRVLASKRAEELVYRMVTEQLPGQMAKQSI